MRKRGLTIEVASINPSDRSRKDLPPVEAAEADRTFYVKSGGFIRVGFRVFVIALLRPLTVLRGLRVISNLGGWDLRSRAFALFYLAEALLVGQWMRRRSLQHLHVHFGGPVATVGMLVSKTWKIPWSLTLHGPDEFFDQDAFYLRQKIDSASFVVCISDFCRSQVLRIAPEMEDDRLEVIRLGVNCDELRPQSTNLTAPDEKSSSSPIRIVCTGRMVTAKGHRILLQALALLAADGLEISCTLIGDGPERRSLESLSRRLGIVEHIQFLGAMAHQATLSEVAQADIFVLASFAEGLPVALMEAMALGVPCVSTTIAAIPELIENGENGLLTPPANPVALHTALARLVNDIALRRHLGYKARATVDIHYNLEINLGKLAEMWSRRLPEDT